MQTLKIQAMKLMYISKSPFSNFKLSFNMLKFAILLVVVLLFSAVVYSQQNAKPIDLVFSTKDGAIQGYDPVAYFTDGKPVKGKTDLVYVWKDATWHFASDEHRNLFEQNPEKYAPEFGGYCAYGWSKGYNAKIDPIAWTILNDKLYLNYNLDVKAKWDEKRREYIEMATKNYQKAVEKAKK
jgi:YHS domain-containing protein